jgi:hypothetical protein
MAITQQVKVRFIIMCSSSQFKGILLQLVNNYDYEAIMALPEICFLHNVHFSDGKNREKF